MSLPKSIVAVKERQSQKYYPNLMHLFDDKKSGYAICGIGGTPSEWYKVSKGLWENFPNCQCSRCQCSLRGRKRAALREKS